MLTDNNCKWHCLCIIVLLAVFGCKKDNNPAGKPGVVIKAIDSTLTFNNVVILGNSITYTEQNPAIGWFGNWGMAATKADSDYVHILTSYFKIKNPNVSVKTGNILPFEVDPIHYDFDATLKPLRESKPDLVIVRIGENVSADVDLVKFDERYTALIKYFKTDNPEVIVLGAGSIWGSVIDNVMLKHPPYVLLKSIVNDGSNFSYGLINADISVQAHPSDKGMRNIAGLLKAKIKMLRLADSH